MNDISALTIQLSKSKLTIMLLGSMAFVGLGIWFVADPASITSWRHSSESLAIFSGIASILFFGLMSFVISKKIFDTTPGLIISNDGLTDNSSGISAGFVPWSDIKEITEIKIVNQQFIKLVVGNPEVYIARQPNAFKRWVAQRNYKMYGSPIGISANGLKYTYEDLNVLIQRRFQEYKSKSNH